MARTKFSDQATAPVRELDKEEAVNTSTAVAPVAGTQDMLPITALGTGQAGGDIDEGDIRLPRLELVYGVGELSENFDAGDIVYNKELLLATKGNQVFMTVIKIRKYYMEDLPFDPNREEMARSFNTKEEVTAAGLWVDWNMNGQKKPPVAECADLMVMVECPEGMDDSLFPWVYTDAAGKSTSLTVAAWTVRKTSYTRVAKPVFSAMAFGLRDNLLAGRWCLHTERKKSGDFVTTLPVFRNIGRNDEAFVTWMRQQLG
jgi:hypothetical protein